MEEMEQPAAPESVGNEPAQGAPEAEQATGLLDGSEPNPNEQELPVAEEDEEIEHDGEKFKVPKKLKDAFLRQADYTRKTQEVSETKRQLEARENELKQHFEQRQAQIQAQTEFQQKHIEDVAKVVSIDQRLKQLASL